MPRATVAARVVAPPRAADQPPRGDRHRGGTPHLAGRILLGRRVLHFVDNTVALSKAVHGYANEPDMAAATNAIHVCDAVFGIDAWFEWVPSHANVSDLPSREPATWDDEARAIMAALRERMAAQGFGRRDLRLPTVAELEDPSEMLRRAREVVAQIEAGVRN